MTYTHRRAPAHALLTATAALLLLAHTPGVHAHAATHTSTRTRPRAGPPPSSPAAHAHPDPSLSRVIRFHAAHVDPAQQPTYHDPHTDTLYSHPPGVDPPPRHAFLVQLHERSGVEQRAAIERMVDHELRHYFPPDTWLVYTDTRIAHKLAQSKDIVQWVGTYQPQYKMHDNVKDGFHTRSSAHHGPSLVAHMLSVSARNASGTVDPRPQSAPVGSSFLNVHLVVPHARSELDTYVQQWRAHWQGAHGVLINVVIVKDSKLIVELHDEALLLEVVSYLTSLPYVYTVARRPVMHYQHAWSRGISQLGVVNPDYSALNGMAGFGVGVEPGLTGDGQVIGLGDSGLDWQSCFFHDPSFPNGPPMRDYVSDPTPDMMYSPSDSAHRKIVQYVTFGDASDDNGHGTHVASSAAGSTVKPLAYSSLNGMAERAKLAFFDLGVGAYNNLDLPPSLDDHYLAWAYAAGARIHSNSWGSDYNGYDSEAMEMDAFQWANPDMLVIVAAGNDGARGARSIGSPATAKNVLAVGASVNSPQAWYATFCNSGYVPTQSLCGTIEQFSKLYTRDSVAGFSAQGPTADGRLKPDIMAPGMFTLGAQHGQTASRSCANSPELLLDFEAGTSMSAPIVAGNAALLRQYFMDGYWPSGVKRSADGFTPSGALLKAMIIASGVAMTGYVDKAAYLFNQAAPAPSPSPLDPPPNPIQGYGRMQLNVSMALFGSESSTLLYRPRADEQQGTGRTVNSYGDAVFQSAADAPITYHFCQHADLSSGIPAKVTLAWTDYPAALNTPNVLVNDVDLTVSDGRTAWRGNGPLNNGAADRKNNVEQVILPGMGSADSTKRQYTVTVTPVAIQYPQPVALVLTGRITAGSCDDMSDMEEFRWVAGVWSACSAHCAGGVQTRSIGCVSSLNGDVDAALCDINAGTRPASSQACNVIACSLVSYEWRMSSWSGCSATCGGGAQTRSVDCMTVTSTPVVVDHTYCADHAMPFTSQACNLLPCTNGTVTDLNTHWSISPCTSCRSSCTCDRDVRCLFGDLTVSDEYCHGQAKPPTVIECTDWPCGSGSSTGGVEPGETFHWVTYEWSACTVGCGGGHQSRLVRCRSSMGYYDVDDRCPTAKPMTVHPCNLDVCPPPDDSLGNYVWVSGVWGRCWSPDDLSALTRSFVADPHAGIQRRWVVCADTVGRYADSAKCEAHVGPQPATVQSCLSPSPWHVPVPLLWQWWADQFGDPSRWCGPQLGIQTRHVWCLGSEGLVGTNRRDCVLNVAGPAPPSVIAASSSTCGTCTNASCASTAQWYGGRFMGCTHTDPCQGSEHRHVFCVAPDGTKLADRSACTQPMIAALRAPCGACTHKPNSNITDSNANLQQQSPAAVHTPGGPFKWILAWAMIVWVGMRGIN